MLIVSHSAVRMVDSRENPPEGATPLQLVIQRLFLKHKPCVRVSLALRVPWVGWREQDEASRTHGRSSRDEGSNTSQRQVVG